MDASARWIESLAFLAMVALFVGLEYRFAHVPSDGRRHLPRHLGAAAWSTLAHAGLRSLLLGLVFIQPGPIRFGRLFAALLLVDLGLYLAHRLMHTRWLWRTHVLHHSTENLAWLSGFRGSAVHAYAHVLVQVGVFVLLGLNTHEVLTGFVVAVVLQFWAHANLGWDLGPLRFLIVTPANHRMHHSAEPRFFGRNFCEVFMLWDHVFGTYLDPRLAPHTPVGLGGEPALRWRAWLGV